MCDEFCNCEDCWWARGEELVCSCCGCLESACPLNNEEKENNEEKD